MAFAPQNSSPAAEKRLADRSKSGHCEDGSLTCGWAKLSVAVKSAFAIVVQDEAVISRLILRLLRHKCAAPKAKS